VTDSHVGGLDPRPLAERMQWCPPLSSARVTLTPLLAAHAVALFPLLADDALWRYTDEAAPTSLSALTERFRRWETRESPDASQRWLNWALGALAAEPAGFVQATVFIERREADVAYVVGRRWWSAGLATESARLVLGFLSETLQVKRVYATVDARNAASLRVLDKLGFVSTCKSDCDALRFVKRFD
jgi:ribosomal-protein-alanine N-acetyltransferase